MKRSKFSLSNYKLLSANMGGLYPCGLVEVLPGDSLQQATSLLLRCSPLLAPVMHPVQVRLHHWFVPHRIIWDDWEKFITGGPDGMDDSVFPTITMPGGGAAIGSLADYFGVPTGVPNLEVSALPFRAYNLIYNQFYRDQDLSPEVQISTASGPDADTDTDLLRASWEKDYFTSARPWEQKGPTITIPLGGEAPVRGIYASGSATPIAATALRGVDPSMDGNANINWSSTSQVWGIGQQGTGNAYRPDVFADLSDASAITVTLLREALALQRYEEARARFGSRYVEYLRYLGVRSSDARLQLPEYLVAASNRSSFRRSLLPLRPMTTPSAR